MMWKIQAGTGADLEKWVVRGFAVFLVGLMLVTWFLTERAVNADELTMYNPIYTYVHYGRMMMPVQGQPDYMTVHPPIHYLAVAWLMKWGLSYYYAEAVPVCLLFAVAIVLIVQGGFPSWVKIALMTGTFLGLHHFLLAVNYTGFQSIRPDPPLAVAWFAGLIALESGRLAGWDWKRLVLGAFLLTYASGIHYFGAPAFLGTVVYGVWVWKDLGFAKARMRLLALGAGSCLFGIPYLLWFVIPDWERILEIVRGVQGEGGILNAIQRHYGIYDYDLKFGSPTELGLFYMRPILHLRIPLMLVGSGVLFTFSATRGLALAGLPVPLFVLLYSQKKTVWYLSPEYTLYIAAAVMLTIALLLWAIQRSRLPIPQVASILAVVVALGLIISRNWYTTIQPIVTIPPPIHEMEVIRAASRQMIGSNALVGGRITRWYVSGADHWYDISPELLSQPEAPKDLKGYFSLFDVIVDDTHMGNATSNHQNKTISAWYADGTLKLSNFFFSKMSATGSSHLMFKAEAPATVEGYGYDSHQLFHFRQQDEGDYLFVSAVCPYGSLSKAALQADYFNQFSFPNLQNAALSPTQDLTAFLVAKAKYNRAKLAACQVRDEVAGTLQPEALAPVLDNLKQTDQTIRFYPTLEEARVSKVAAVAPDPIYVAQGHWDTWQPTPETRVQLKESGTIAQIKGSRSQYDVRLLSPNIKVEPHTNYQINVSTLPLEGGFSLTVSNAQQKPLYSKTWCSAVANLPTDTRFVVNTKDTDQLLFVFSSCNHYQPRVSKFKVKQLEMRKAVMSREIH